ncbi:helix-turn-helix domain-containing protein [Flavobacterium sp.]
MRLLKISESTLYRYRKQKIIPYTKLGGKYLYPKISIKNLIHKAMNQK